MRRTWPHLLLMIGGLVLIGTAALVSNAAIERALVSDSARSLAWGPTFFRILLTVHGLALIVVALVSKEQASTSAPLSVRSSATRSFDDRKITTRSWIVLSVLSLLGLALRLWHLNTDLWFDELLTLLNYLRLPLGDLVTSLPDQNNHLLFSVLSHASVSLFGESAWAVRLPSVLFGVMSLWALFLLGRRVVGTREALLACALMTFSYHHIWFSQNARGYMALLFFSLLATWLWLEALDRQAWGWWLTYSVAVTGGMLSHMTMAFVVAAHVLVYLAMLWSQRRSEVKRPGGSINWRPFVAWTLCVSLTAQLYALALPEFLRVGLHEVSLESEWTSPWWVLAETLRNLRIGFSGLLVVGCGGAMVFSGLWSMLRREWQTAVLMVLPALLAGGSMVAAGHNLWPRFFFFSMGFALLIAVHGAVLVPQLLSSHLTTWKSREAFGKVAGATLACLMIAASAVTVPRNYAHPKQDYTGAREYVESHRRPGDAVVAVGLAGVAYGRYFAPRWSVAQTHEELDAVRTANSNVWLVYTLPVEVRAYRPDVWHAIQSDFEVVKVFPGTLGGGEVFVCRQRSTKPGTFVADN
ncbi:MAG TPA: glycosyltransferase family 39 protein [Pyrinomonadaceae bacterium]|nr:glycosyltransferase family 39 protein [Pyrinomonadaceae bacterium]